MAPSFFIFGATGYVGGAVLTGILKHYGPKTPVTALVRSEKNFPPLVALGVKILHGSHSDVDLISQNLYQHSYNVVVNCADADDLGLTKAILAGLSKRKSEGAPTPILVHTSGVSVIADAPLGKWLDSVKIYDDVKPADLKSIAPTQLHREIDLAIVGAADAGDVRSYIVVPSTIYGVAYENPVHKVSKQIPMLVQIVKNTGKAAHIGDGTNRWDNVHVLDLVNLYLLIIESALVGSSTYNTPWEHFYFAAVGTHEWGATTKEIAKILESKGVIQPAEYAETTVDEIPLLFYVASNALAVSTRAKALGWKPKQKTLEENLPEEVNFVIS